ncbi:MAG: hypothetical protein QF464_23585 [Myxococcota bacterium]|nr:hypothetical protein [Myxococcota bacterium]
MRPIDAALLLDWLVNEGWIAHRRSLRSGWRTGPSRCDAKT